MTFFLFHLSLLLTSNQPELPCDQKAFSNTASTSTLAGAHYYVFDLSVNLI